MKRTSVRTRDSYLELYFALVFHLLQYEPSRIGDIAARWQKFSHCAIRTYLRGRYESNFVLLWRSKCHQVRKLVELRPFDDEWISKEREMERSWKGIHAS